MSTIKATITINVTYESSTKITDEAKQDNIERHLNVSLNRIIDDSVLLVVDCQTITDCYGQIETEIL